MRRARLGAVAAIALGAALAVAGVIGLGASSSATRAAWTDPAFATAAPATGTWAYQIRLSGTQLCLDVLNRENTDGLGVQIYACNSTPAQIWTLNADESLKVYQAAGQWNATDNPTPRCLEVPGSSTGQDIALQIRTCVMTAGSVTQANQKWYVQTAGTGTVTIRSRLNGTGGAARCLDVPSGSVVTGTTARVRDCTAANRSRVWVMEPVTAAVY
ncbi:RICIN domain-containing protein [Cellulomonas edaphi]|uniref:RICIN domain-containing protein n=1 Tax=Cellulomonas edaphi TaxID=3053468 RepID=A0ABT7S4I0_9CELL|nr:RICIN domain-containing protein [Cellulomons edaphi]MDM7830496.1 RICIN domain-containing protein [Cellulomons edaphi]